MKDLIDVFKMDELPPKTRARIIIKIGNAINDTHGINITEDIVYELVMILDPDNDVIKQERYQRTKT
jgi:hypothetical protein